MSFQFDLARLVYPNTSRMLLTSFGVFTQFAVLIQGVGWGREEEREDSIDNNLPPNCSMYLVNV